MMDDVAKVNETGHTSSFPIHILSTISQRAPLAINVTTYTLAQLKAMCPTYVQSS